MWDRTTVYDFENWHHLEAKTLIYHHYNKWWDDDQPKASLTKLFLLLKDSQREFMCGLLQIFRNLNIF